MTTLKTIPGIGESSLELLEAAGYGDVESLAKVGVDELAGELARANKILRISKETPDRTDVREWISTARELTGTSGVPLEADSHPEADFEDSGEADATLAGAPFAIPLPGRQLMEQKLGVGDIAPAIFPNRRPGDFEARSEERPQPAKQARTVIQSIHVRAAEQGETAKLEIDTTRVKGIEALAGKAPRRPSSPKDAPKTPQDERVALIRTAREETNRGKNPNSRRYIRGVLHSHPISMMLGAVVTLLIIVALPTAIVSAGLLLLSSELPAQFGWVPQWILAFPMALPVIGVSYLVWGLNGSCRICGQRQFWPRMCLKNSKAHYVPGIGYIIPVALHMLTFRWFRCTYCGTPVRLKK